MAIYAMIETKSGKGELPSELDPKNEGLVYGLNLGDPSIFSSLNDLARELGVEPLGKFHYEDWDDFDDEELEEFRPKNQTEWHKPADGLRAVEALVKLFRKPNRPQLAAAGIDEASIEGVLWDLSAYELILKQAKAEKDPFRITIM